MATVFWKTNLPFGEMPVTCPQNFNSRMIGETLFKGSFMKGIDAFMPLWRESLSIAISQDGGLERRLLVLWILDWCTGSILNVQESHSYAGIRSAEYTLSLTWCNTNYYPNAQLLIRSGTSLVRLLTVFMFWTEAWNDTSNAYRDSAI